MVKSLSALAVLALLGVSVIILPGFAPKVETGTTAVPAKGDRLAVRAAVSNCSTRFGRISPHSVCEAQALK
jgi:hypothetical protein